MNERARASRAALEAELRPGELSSIREWSRVSLAPYDAWPSQRALACFVDLALARYIDQNRRRSHKRTVEAAAVHFGVNPETIKARMRRRRAAARKANHNG